MKNHTQEDEKNDQAGMRLCNFLIERKVKVCSIYAYLGQNNLLTVELKREYYKQHLSLVPTIWENRKVVVKKPKDLD
jgi:hypothetical protein